MKRVIVTGATGFVGANLARRLLSDGHEVHLLLRRGHAAWRIAGIASAVRCHEVDLGDREGLQRAFDLIRPEWVFHLAVHGAYSSQTDLREMVQTNIIGTINLVEAALSADVAAFVNTGSSSEYGLKDHAPTENEWLDPNSYYAVTKASATQYCRHMAHHSGLLLPTLRLYSVYGPYEEPTRLIPALVTRGLRGELPPLVDPAVSRDYVYVDDVVEAYLLAATVPEQEIGAVYNIGTAVQTPLHEVVGIARRVMDITAEPVWGSMPNRGWDTTIWVADNRKIRSSLGWYPRISFEEGLCRMIDWLKSEPILVERYARQLASSS
ncbi:MAG TPA: SDR family NAD(P)-dependent oxidoreductase [Thermomicrobiales bacterium]|jgi:nucleoside-diphosphate-sugar epimerase